MPESSILFFNIALNQYYLSNIFHRTFYFHRFSCLIFFFLLLLLVHKSAGGAAQAECHASQQQSNKPRKTLWNHQKNYLTIQIQIEYKYTNTNTAQTEDHASQQQSNNPLKPMWNPSKKLFDTNKNTNTNRTQIHRCKYSAGRVPCRPPAEQ